MEKEQLIEEIRIKQNEINSLEVELENLNNKEKISTVRHNIQDKIKSRETCYFVHPDTGDYYIGTLYIDEYNPLFFKGLIIKYKYEFNDFWDDHDLKIINSYEEDYEVFKEDIHLEFLGKNTLYSNMKDYFETRFKYFN